MDQSPTHIKGSMEKQDTDLDTDTDTDADTDTDMDSDLNQTRMRMHQAAPCCGNNRFRVYVCGLWCS